MNPRPSYAEVGAAPEAPHDCALCPRLIELRALMRETEPGWFNAPVPSFGTPGARLLIVGLAPGLKGANRTGRPFTGDYAGELLYATLLRYGFASGHYGAQAGDGLVLSDAMISNAVRCVPPANKPLPSEIAACRPFLAARISSLENLTALLALGRVAHEQTLAALGHRRSNFPFKHGARHRLAPGLMLFDSFHCSRYNTNTGRLTPEMFHAVFEDIVVHLGGTPAPSDTKPEGR